KYPRTRPKLIDGKKSSRSILKTKRRLRCCCALVMMDRLRLKPCAIRSFRFLAALISSRQSCSRVESLCWRSFKESAGALMVRFPPLRLGISKVLYLRADGCLNKIYESAAGLNCNRFATSLSVAVDLRLASLDIAQKEK